MNKMAFPSIVDDGETMSWDRGMTLRDYFAAKAIQALITRETKLHHDILFYAGASYDLADAMLKARDQ